MFFITFGVVWSRDRVDCFQSDIPNTVLFHDSKLWWILFCSSAAAFELIMWQSAAGLSKLVQAPELLQPEACLGANWNRGRHTDMTAPNSLPLVDKQDDRDSHREGGLDRLNFVRE